MSYSRYTERVEARIRLETKKILKTLSKKSRVGESTILRNIIEPALLRRAKKLNN